jgi:hypothetical protein
VHTKQIKFTGNFQAQFKTHQSNSYLGVVYSVEACCNTRCMAGNPISLGFWPVMF